MDGYKIWYIYYTMEYYLAIKKNKIGSFEETHRLPYKVEQEREKQILSSKANAIGLNEHQQMKK